EKTGEIGEIDEIDAQSACGASNLRIRTGGPLQPSRLGARRAPDGPPRHDHPPAPRTTSEPGETAAHDDTRRQRGRLRTTAARLAEAGGSLGIRPQHSRRPGLPPLRADRARPAVIPTPLHERGGVGTWATFAASAHGASRVWIGRDGNKF